MAITTYDELKASIASWLNRDDLTAVIPDFIALAESSINRDLRHYKMVQRADATLDSRYVQVPEDWLETMRFSITSGTTFRIEPTSIDDLVQLRQQTADHHRMGRQAGRQLPGGARAILADQMRHHVQGVRERVRGFHVTTLVTFISPVQGPHLFHMDTFVL